MYRNWSIRWRLFSVIVLAAGLILTMVISYGYFQARQLLETELEAKAWQLSYATANRIAVVEKAVTKVAGSLQAVVELFPLQSNQELYLLLERLVQDNEELSGIALALEPESDNNTKLFSVYRDNNQVIGKDSSPRTNYTLEDWYALPRNLHQPYWSEPYSVQGDRELLMVTYSVPVYAHAGKGSFLGVVKCDLSLEWLHGLLLGLPLEKNGYAFLLSKNGTFVAHPEKQFILKENIFSRAEEQGNELLRQLGRDMVKGRSAFIRYDQVVDKEKGWLLYQPVAATGWVLGVFFPQEAMSAKVLELSRKEFAIGLMGFLLLIPAILLIARSITRPLQELDKAARVLATGNLDVSLPHLNGRDEVARLTETFAIMRNELQVHMSVLEETTAMKERIESELRIASDIQMSLVPKVFPPFPERSDFEVYAVMNPAREVGGDFYDFFMPNDESICITIGDVSGKGVPAALLMAVSRTLLRAFLQGGDSPGVALARLNNEVAQNNELCMFVTVFCMVVHLPSGSFRFANGGHNLPYVVHKDGSITSLPKTKGAALGVMEGLTIKEGEAVLLPGEMVFLYTDGVTEAMNRQGEFFGEERTTKILAQGRMLSCTELLSTVSQAVMEFADGAEQSDDITMTAFRYVEPPSACRQSAN